MLNSVGRDLYEKFFLSYTRKQWGLDPSELKAGVAARIPVRTNTDDRYFTDTFQAMPRHGYTRMFETMLDHPNISVELGVDFADVCGRDDSGISSIRDPSTLTWVIGSAPCPTGRYASNMSTCQSAARFSPSAPSTTPTTTTTRASPSSST